MIGKYMPLGEPTEGGEIRVSRMGQVYALAPVFRKGPIGARTDAYIHYLNALHRAINLISGANLLPVNELFLHDGVYYIAQGPLPREAKLLTQYRADLPMRQLERMEKVASALLRLHNQGIVHGSLRPELIWVASDGLWLSGFGASAFEGRAMVADGEDFLLKRHDDCFAFGIMLYQMLTGCLSEKKEELFSQEAASYAALPVELRLLITAMLSSLPQNRPEDGRVLAVLHNCRMKWNAGLLSGEE